MSLRRLSLPHENPPMTDILDLPGWTVLGKRLDGAEYELELALADPLH